MLSRTALLGALCLAATTVAASPQASSQSIRIERAWARPTPPGAPTGAGYMTVRNHGRAADRLLSASSPIARRVELHESSMTNGVMRMRPLPAGVPLAPRSSVSFQPGGRHLMLVGLSRPLIAGQSVPVTLRFERAGEVRVDLKVDGAQGATRSHHSGTHHE